MKQINNRFDHYPMVFCTRLLYCFLILLHKNIKTYKNTFKVLRHCHYKLTRNVPLARAHKYDFYDAYKI